MYLLTIYLSKIITFLTGTSWDFPQDLGTSQLLLPPSYWSKPLEHSRGEARGLHTLLCCEPVVRASEWLSEGLWCEYQLPEFLSTCVISVPPIMHTQLATATPR